ncbi:MAG: sulfotransferase family protein [Planctomycetaceae bacterium]|nr:sulfotransferase family protein [Planctomycetaceae bacterium]
MSDSLRIAMWSGPRNISTAMIRSWGNRNETFVCDEPFYANYLQVTGLDHPMAAEIIQHHEPDWQKVVDWLTGEVPDGRRVFYQKQMTHHLLPHISREWLSSVSNCFLIRDPAEVIPSYIKKNDEPTLEDIGFVQQLEIFNIVREQTGKIPPVLDSKDVLANPRISLGNLCDALGLEFSEAMLSWEAGLRDTDGIWASHWYPEVETSTGFREYQPKNLPIPEHLTDIYEKCLEVYEELLKHRLQ